ncbi:hypothetical protein K2173_022206 [Erythroxylum novogranatense]|uniref:Uncharacterized protein n=1 Tax=Erythroxylum novogranatense TaxID=1862640 RepID=A0AAV8SUC6_9ROSI|nr:hypothetical protein K2173_022206 [Erythroxylum novogranatense]
MGTHAEAKHNPTTRNKDFAIYRLAGKRILYLGPAEQQKDLAPFPPLLASVNRLLSLQEVITQLPMMLILDSYQSKLFLRQEDHFLHLPNDG